MTSTDEQPVVVNVLYGEPSDPAAFEAYYAETHLPLVDRIAGLDRAVLIKGLPGPDGSKPAYYRIAQLFYRSAAQMAQAMGSPEGQAAAADLANFADGGVTIMVGEVR
ncbi:EthD family reductase [Novosphingobium aerophilum]|uniref:EthD family reductase n=1 Tax=Novosphingobium aerophilum TaxID=2839843 RepID=A0A7X1KDM7_9SPHN|nr:EthD family reductase [Novosphingobium aerophilum]MBC2653433.1 EthD family reductase [Novosphingobium aerophilum]